MIKKQKIVHMTSVHSIKDVRILSKECRSLVESGYDVTLVIPCSESGYRQGVDIASVPEPTTRLERMLITTGLVYKTALSLNADLYHFHDAELMPIGILLKLKGKKVVYDVHEELSESIQDKDWLPKALRYPIAQMIGLIERFCSKFYDAIIVTRMALLRRFSEHKTVLVGNYPLVGELENLNAFPFSRRPRIGAYVGVITPQRGIREILSGLSLLPDTCPFELHIAGTIPPELEAELALLPGWDRVRVLGWQTREEVARLLSSARFGIVLFLPTANHIRSEPTKLYEYMSAGLPVIGSDMPHWREIIHASGFGIVVDPFDPKAIAEAIQYMLDHSDEAESMGGRGSSAIREAFNWDREKEKLLSLYKRLLG